MPTLSIYVSDQTLERLTWYARERGWEGCTVETLAEAAVEEEALRSDDRVREKPAP